VARNTELGTGAGLFRAPDPNKRPGWAPALAILGAGLAAVEPAAAVRRALSLAGDQLHVGALDLDLSAVDRVLVVAAGKAATAMVQAAEAVLGARLSAGVAATAPGTKGPTQRVTLHEGGHPLPNPASLMAARHVARLVAGTTDRDLVLVLLSGGASALLELPAGRITLADLQQATSALLASGATIHELNTVRKHLSAIKGGGLARLAAPAQVAALVLSDVVGNPLEVIASGPTVPDPSTFADAAEVLSRYNLWGQLPASVGDYVRAGLAGTVPETAKPGDALFERVTTTIVGDNGLAATAAWERATALGYNAQVLTTWLQGEAREAGLFLAAVGKEIATSGRPLAAPACVVVGGETTVTLKRLGGHGGRNQELALAAALAVTGWPAVTIASLGTDGVDGLTEHAGAVVDGTTVARAAAAGLDPRRALSRHDSGSFFASLGDALVTGPTGTNVNDLAVVLVDRTQEA
jgi:glycerate 2-kinase